MSSSTTTKNIGLFSCACGSHIQNTKRSLKAHNKTKKHKTFLKTKVKVERKIYTKTGKTKKVKKKSKEHKERVKMIKDFWHDIVRGGDGSKPTKKEMKLCLKFLKKQTVSYDSIAAVCKYELNYSRKDLGLVL